MNISAIHTVDSHFESRDAIVRQIYDSILEQVSRFGPVGEDPKKTSIHLTNRSAFAGIQTRRGSLILTIKSRSDINNKRITRREQASANRWHLEVNVSDPAGIDAELLAWLNEAYQMSN